MQILDAKDNGQFLPELARALHEEWGAEQGYTFEETLEWCRDVAASTVETILVAVEADQLVGTASLVENDLGAPTEYTPWLASLWIDPAQRKKGIASRLVTAIEELAHSQGHEELFLFCVEGTLPDFYERLGWQKREQIVNLGRRCRIMSRNLVK